MRFQNLWRVASLSWFVLSTTGLHAQATTYTYTYAGNHFTAATAPYTTSESVTGYFTTAAPLAANLSDADISSQTQFFSFSAGQSTWTKANSAYSGQRVSTDAQGHITAWLFYLSGELGSVSGVDMITCNGIPPTDGGCGNKYDVIFNDNSPQTDLASILNSPGIWSGAGVGTPNGPSISATPAALNFQTPQGAAPPSQSLQVTGTQGAAWQAAATTSTGGNWLSLSPATGTIPGSLTVTAKSGSLPPGTYQGNITIQAPGATPASTTVGVTLAVGGATYTYQGNNLNYFFGATGLSTSNFISASLTFLSPLPDSFFGDPGGTPNNNLTPKDQIMPIAWSISDGVHTFSSGNGAGLNYLELETDSNGGIFSWYMIACATPVCATGDASLVTAFDDPSSPGYVYDLYGYEYTGTSGELAYVKSNPGKWVLASATVNSTAPSILPGGIVPLYGSVNTIQAGEWISIYGANLANSTLTWNANFPTSLGGTSVTINGKPGYLSFVSPGQINLQAPTDTATGPVPVVVTTATGTATATVTLAQSAPSFLLLDSQHVAGIISRADGSGAYGGGSYDLLGPTGNSLGYPTVAAEPGDTVALFAVGLGPTNPAVPAGQPFSAAAPTTNPVNLFIDDLNVVPSFAGLSGAGLDQINFTVPSSLPAGDLPLVATVGAAQTQPGVVIPIQSASSSPCVNIGGTWSVSEAGTYTETIAAAVETDTVTNPVSGSGTTKITQTGCSISYNPLTGEGLLGSNLTPSQQASLTRTGTVSGNNVSVTGLLGLVDTVGSLQAGFTVTDVSTNVLSAGGQLTGNEMTLNENGSLVVSGTYSRNGQSGTFTETLTTSSTATFTQDGILATVAGNGTSGLSGDGGPATSAELDLPEDIAVDADGNLFVADPSNNRVRKVSVGGIITTVAGNGTPGFSGDGGPATSAQLYEPAGVAVDRSGNLFIADGGNNRIRKVSSSGIITTVAGSTPPCSQSSAYCGAFSGDGGPAIAAQLHVPFGVTVDAAGNLFIVDSGNDRIRKVSANGIITTVAGNGPVPCEISNPTCQSFAGDGGPATSATLGGPLAVAVDSAGNLYIADTGNNRIRKVSTDGIITTIAGNGIEHFSGDGGPAASAQLNPVSVAVDAYGNLFIGDAVNNRVREISPGGMITTVVGNGTRGFSGDGGLATAAQLYGPNGVAVDGAGSIFIADAGNNRIRKVSPAAASAVQPASAPATGPKPGQMGVRFAAVAASAPLNITISLH